MSAAEATVRNFNDCINRRDLAGLSRLMAPGHTFVDPAGMVLTGRDTCTRAWKDFFDSFPEYQNNIESVRTTGKVVSMEGFSVCPGFPDLEGPAIWTVTVEHEQVLRWQVADPGKGQRPLRTAEPPVDPGAGTETSARQGFGGTGRQSIASTGPRRQSA